MTFLQKSCPDEVLAQIFFRAERELRHTGRRVLSLAAEKAWPQRPKTQKAPPLVGLLAVYETLVLSRT